MASAVFQWILTTILAFYISVLLQKWPWYTMWKYKHDKEQNVAYFTENKVPFWM
jgi:hypothetical protein